MGILLGFTPFILFTLITDLSVSLALWVSFAAAFAIGIRDFLHAKMVRTLDAGCLVLFAILALYAGFIQPSMTVQAVRMIADLGLFLLALVSLGLKSPFTLQYARDEVPEAEWEAPEFLRANYTLTGVWAGAFFVMATADGFATFSAETPFALDIAVGLAALAFAIVFTVRWAGVPMRGNTPR
ncbi:MAG TPA: hypothetical protein VG867_04770 [Rhizomicrobium sp.]|nr:hypothetical protein [Rhizomicrobium sp.]